MALLAAAPLAVSGPASASTDGEAAAPGAAAADLTTRTASTAPIAGTTPTVEEQRLDRAVPQEILRRSGFDGVRARFVAALAGAESYESAERIVAEQGSALWRRAVERVQGSGPVRGDLSRDDDRPLYWARLSMTRELRGWQAEFGLDDTQRAALLRILETTSRGQEDVRYPAASAHDTRSRDAAAHDDRSRDAERGMRRVLLTGFDPFTLDRDIRISNPSGAAALALDGTVIETADGPARIETVVFPVRWADFTEQAVERALAPHLPEVDLFTTVSQGRRGKFDIERTNGAWRGGFGDNDNVSRKETVPVSAPATQPQWTSTTLPYKEIAEADTGRFPVYDNTQVTEIPAGGTEPVVRPDGPTPGSTARAGGGGDYLSNEIAYRATLLRDRLGLTTLPGGHVHTPVLEFGPGNTDPATGIVTDPDFLRNRADIVAQVREILRVATEAGNDGPAADSGR